MSGPLFGPGPGVVTPGTPPLDGPGRDTYILYTYKYRRLETSRLISYECHTKSLRKSHKNTSDRHGFVNPTRFICYGKFRPHFKAKKLKNIQIFANPTGLAIPPCYGRSTPSDFESHPQFSLAESKRLVLLSFLHICITYEC